MFAYRYNKTSSRHMLQILHNIFSIWKFPFWRNLVVSLWEKAVEQLFPSWMAKQISPPLKTITFEKQPPGTLGRGLFERVPSDWEKRLIMEFTPQLLLRQRGYSSYGILLESLTWTLCFWECFPAQPIKILLCIYDTITRKCSLWGVCYFSNYQGWLQNLTCFRGQQESR